MLYVSRGHDDDEEEDQEQQQEAKEEEEDMDGIIVLAIHSLPPSSPFQIGRAHV